MKKHTLLFIALFGLLSLNAQNDKQNKMEENNLNRNLLTNEDFFEKSKLIVEVIFLKVFSSYDAKEIYNNSHQTNDVQFLRVHKLCKELNNGILFIARKGNSEVEFLHPKKMDFIHLHRYYYECNSTGQYIRNFSKQIMENEKNYI